MRILFVGGGSVGHIAPSVAVWRAIQVLDAKAEAHFVCADREDDQVFLKAEQLPFTVTHAPRASWKFPFQFWYAYKQAKNILRGFQTTIVFSKGGYVSVPLCLAAKHLGIPIVLHESDVVSGRANSLVARWAARVCLGFPGTESDAKSVFTGNPFRTTITSGSREEALAITGLTGKRPVLLVMGGSQGAQAINEVIYSLLPALLEDCDVLHITGRGKDRNIARRGYWSRPFITHELSHLYALATVAVSRAGAGSICELAANGIPTILVPLRGVAHDHQQQNAERVAQAGACVLIQQDALEEELELTVHRLVRQPDVLAKYSAAFRTFTNVSAAKDLAKIVLEVLAEKH